MAQGFFSVFKKGFDPEFKRELLETVRSISTDIRHSVKGEMQREKILKSFYSEYMKFVFGIPAKDGTKRKLCLLNAIESPAESTVEEKGFFAINFMNRLLFIKFMEDIGVIPHDLLKEMWKEFENRGDITGTFYKSNVEPLFFGVFNKLLHDRDRDIQQNVLFSKIPYLNGELFKIIVKNEREFDIKDDIFGIIINEFIQNYSFTVSGERGLDPDILGNVFEKTINYLSRTGTNAQKAKGAYYTPDDVVTFIIKGTLYPYVLNKIREAYTKRGWTVSDLSLYTSLESFLSNLPHAREDVEEALHILDGLTIVDPACGSGHFLTSALKELFYIKKRLLDEIGEEYNPYQLKTEIIRRNLFGVDIEAQAIEIAKLRLWLSLMGDLETESQNGNLGTLPTMEYNIVQGNSLTGQVDEPMEQEMQIKPNEEVQNVLEELKLLYADEDARSTLREVKENLNTSNAPKILGAYVLLKNMYRSETSERAEKLKILIDSIHESVYHCVSKKYAACLSTKEGEVLPPGLEDVFHWGIDFYDVIKEGGFDLVIGNPPYVEVPENGRNHFKDYRTRECGNTHAYFYERALHLVKKGGFCGFIVPLASVSTDRMKSLQTLLIEKSARLWVSNYDDRPGKLFSGLEHCRSSIVISQKKMERESTQLFTTRYHRWYSENRDSLFENITYVEATDFILDGSIPKIGTEIEKSILRKISKNKKLVNYIGKKEKKGRIWYHNAPQYWIRGLDFVPYFWNEREGHKISSQLVGLDIHPAEYKKIVAAVLNSSLFYWFFTLYSDERHLVNREIENFPLSVEEIPEDVRRKIEEHFDGLMEDYRRKAERKICEYRTTGRVEYDEFRPGLSKMIMDRIDALFAGYYGFTDEEEAFILNFDREFRSINQK